MLNKIKNFFLNLFVKKDKRRIPLTHVHTFKTGEKLYTYSKEYCKSALLRIKRGIELYNNVRC